MDANTLSLKDIFERDRRHLVPLFQRPYVWEQEAQWMPLWEDVRAVADGLVADREVRPHFLGAIVLEVTTAHPLLLHLFSIGLTSSDLERAVTDIESFLMRRLVCRLTTKNYNRLFLDILKAIRDQRTDVPSVLRQLLLEGSGDSVRWPSDKEFRDAGLEMPVYRTLAHRRVRMILEALEVASRGPKTEAMAVPTKLTIEHVLPQRWEPHWPLTPMADVPAARAERDRLVHTLGNLTLLTKALNPAVSNAPWETKRAEILKHSILVLNGELASVSTWDETAIRERGLRLLARACELWPRPPAPVTAVTPSYAAVARQVMAEVVPGARTGAACPIEGCTYIYQKSFAGWDAHVGSVKRHPHWHPDVAEPEARKALFKAEFPRFVAFVSARGAGEPPSRGFWERRSHPESMATFDGCRALVDTVCPATRWTYTARYIGLGGPKRNFGWFYPKKDAAYCRLFLKVQREKGVKTRDELVARIQAAGMTVAPRGSRRLRLTLTAAEIAQHSPLLSEILARAYRVTNSVN